jgi:hypothetical protein
MNRHKLLKFYAKFVQTERDERRIWSIKEYFSSRGKVLDSSKICIANLYAF